MANGKASPGQLLEMGAVLVRHVNVVFGNMDSGALQVWIDDKTGAVPEALRSGFAVPTFQFDKTADGWELLEDCGPEPTLSPAGIILVPYLNTGEGSIVGEELARRAVGLKANYGQRQAEYFLAHQDKIPAEYRNFYLVFPGTKWRGRDGRRCVPSLLWHGGRWYLGFLYLDSGFYDNGRLVRPRE